MIAGIDGCPKAWIAVSQDDHGSIDSHYVVDLAAFVAQSQLRVAGIDIPIGLTDSGPRKCDVEARSLLKARRSSVFPAPIRPALAARDRQSAHDISMAVQGKGVGAQAFGIYSRVKEVDDLLAASPELRTKICEVHPELSFCTWNDGAPMSNPKRTGPGFMERLALVSACFGKGVFESIRSKYSRNQVADDDILDAFAALWTARRIDAGLAASCPTPPETCPMGWSMAIWH